MADDQQKQAYIDKMNAQMRQWQAEVDKLKAKADEAKAGAEIEGGRKIQDLKARMEAVQSNLDELKQRGEDKWQDMKAKVDSAAAELSNGIEKFRSRLQQ
jgi:uncharacterized coiled-coil DUF342 family protein